MGIEMLGSRPSLKILEHEAEDSTVPQRDYYLPLYILNQGGFNSSHVTKLDAEMFLLFLELSSDLSQLDHIFVCLRCCGWEIMDYVQGQILKA